MEIADPSRFRSAYKFPHQHRATGVLAPFREILEAKPVPFCLPISSTESWCRLDRGLLKRKIPAAATHRPPQSNSGWLATPPAAQLTRPQPTTNGRRTSSPAPHQGPMLLCSRCRRPRHVIPQVLAADCSQSQRKEIRKRNL